MSTPILDASGLTRLAERSVLAGERLRRLRAAGWWPPVVPAVVLTEALRGDPRQDFYEERLLAMTDVEPVDEATARRAAHRGRRLAAAPQWMRSWSPSPEPSTAWSSPRTLAT